MAVIKCKMCGGDLSFEEGATVCECEYCGSKQTLPAQDSEKKLTLFGRAGRLMRACEFDKAASVYESIVAEFPEEAEAYWGLVLSKYGIEYVDDPATGKKVPTCHRSSFESVMEDSDFEQACENADALARKEYREEAKQMEELRRSIIEVSSTEQPYDIFISYKEKDDNGERTLDSVLAQDIYDALTDKGYRVFFSRISLEDRLGTEYEPYIFAALNSAKVMLVVGTDYDYFNAVWVKNEWSRYLKLMAQDKSKHLIPCYKNIDAYDMPKEFNKLTAQDLGKVGATQDLLRGIDKLLGKGAAAPASATQPQPQTIVQQVVTNGTNTDSLLDRGRMALEDREWTKANGFFEEVLNRNSRCAEAYLGELLAREQKSTLNELFAAYENKYAQVQTERLEACPEDSEHIEKAAKENAVLYYLEENAIRTLYPFDRGYNAQLPCRKQQKEKQLQELKNDRLMTRVQQYATGDFKAQLEQKLNGLTAVLDKHVADAQKADNESIARVKENYTAALKAADEKAEELKRDACNRREQDYQNCVKAMNSAKDASAFEAAKESFVGMHRYKDTAELAVKCHNEAQRLQAEQKAEEERKAAEAKRKAEAAAKKKKMITIISIAATAVCIAIALLVTQVIIPANNYKSAVALKNSGEYEAAIAVFEAMNGYRDSAKLEKECKHLNLTTGSAEPGDYVLFGSYEQDNDISNGAENIEWLVLDKTDSGVLLISKYALNCQPYNTEETSVTWETCSLRTWLNSDFYNTAFSTGEQAMIATTKLTTDRNPKNDTDPCTDTQDKVFLLSINEANFYFTADEARQCEPTAYAVANGVYKGTDSGNCWWWLRSPGYGSYGNISAARVSASGSVDTYSRFVDYSHNAVRPALWVQY